MIRFWRRPTRWGALVLAVWLIASGAMQLLQLHFQHSETVLAVVAIAAGILLLLER